MSFQHCLARLVTPAGQEVMCDRVGEPHGTQHRATDKIGTIWTWESGGPVFVVRAAGDAPETLRDRFACAALQAMQIHQPEMTYEPDDHSLRWWMKNAVRAAYLYADMMLAERVRR